MAGDKVDFGPDVCPVGDRLMLLTVQRPKLPAVQPLAMAQMEKRINIIICYHVAFAAPDPDRHQHEFNVVAKQPVFEMATQWYKCGVVLFQIRRALLKVNRK